MAKQTKNLKTYMLLENWSGTEFEARFTFNAKDDKEADDKAFNWARYHGFTPDIVTFRPATEAEIKAQGWLHNEYMR